MQHEKTNKGKEEYFRIFCMSLPRFTSVILKLGKAFLRFKRTAKKGGSLFYDELKKQGIDNDMAERLTQLYLESTSSRNYLHFIRNT
jgi:hypothetical protein